MPIHITEKLNKYKKLQRPLAQKLGRTPSRNELAEAMEMTPQQLSSFIKLTQNPVSLDVPVGVEKTDTMMDVLPDDDEYGLDFSENEELKKAVECAPGNLTEQQREVIRLRFGIDGSGGMTLTRLKTNRLCYSIFSVFMTLRCD